MNLMQYVKDILKIVALWMLTTGLIVWLIERFAPSASSSC